MPITSDYIKSKIDAARAVIGRTVTFYTPATSSDFTASGLYNPITDTSFNVTLIATEVPNVRVHWAGDERITATPGGKYFVGDVSLGMDPEYHELAQKSLEKPSYILVDGKKVNAIGIDPQGVITINRIKLICKSEGTQPSA